MRVKVCYYEVVRNWARGPTTYEIFSADKYKISKSGQEWTLQAQLGQLKTGQDGKGLLQIHLWCPDDLPRLWDRIEKNKYRKVLNVTKLQYELQCNLNFIRLFETLMENDISIFSEIVES